MNHLVRVLRRRWQLLALVVLASIAGAAAAAWLQTPTYQTAAVLVSTTGTAVDGTSATQNAAQRALDVSRFAGTAPVIEQVVTQAAGASGLTARAPAGVSTTADGVSPFLTITVSDSDPQWAQAVANAYLPTLPDALEDIDPGIAGSAEQLTSLTAAPLPGAPATPDRSLYLSMGLLLDLVLGFGLVVLWESLDRDFHDPEDMARALNLPVLGVIPQRDPKQVLPMRTAPSSSRAEAYRAVQASLAFARAEGPPRSIVVTSPSSGEGVTTVAANVALALASSGHRVLLVDVNLRAPSVHDLFELPPGPGLAEVLAGRITPSAALRDLPDTSLRVLTAGASNAHQLEMLTGPRTPQVLVELQADCDVLILDTPPVLQVADALFLAAHSAGILLVARVGVATKDRLRRARDAVRTVQAPKLGLAVNGGSESPEGLGPRRLPASHRSFDSAARTAPVTGDDKPVRESVPGSS
ncbi:MAG TPA: P-loop NTPase [Streptomyces sp.]|uniref:P-loop NTPase n=1 Tax=Streptomyces sp. TaxID=1931 RepID=UPI002BCD1BC2|nr:P-loop NTPase [Streptomyces sp.]HWU12061.1 P-loop NTPase [Streptomyces sp.]